MYSYEDLRYAVVLRSPDGRDVLLQGDDYNLFMWQLDRADEYWEPNEAFPTFQKLIDALIDPYFAR